MSITFNGVLSDSLGVVVERIPNPQIAARRSTSEVVPGRNGVLLQDDGSFATVTESYSMHISAEGGQLFKRAARRVASWLLSQPGFLRLEDSYEADVFRLAQYSGGIDITSYFYDHGTFRCSFECQPQRFLKLGETEISVGSSVDDSVYSGVITLQSIPFGAVSMFVGSSSGSAVYVGNYRNAAGAEIGQAIYDTPVPVPDGAVKVTLAWSNAAEDTTLTIGMVDEDGNRTILGGVTGTSPTVFNPTDYEARPLLKFVDTSEEPVPVQQTITAVNDTYIDGSGEVSVWKPIWSGQTGEGHKTCSPVSVGSYAYAFVSGNSYAFYDSNGNVLSFVSGTSKTRYSNTQVIIPSGSATVVIGTLDGMPSLGLSLKAARPNPGASAVTINGITISLDFSVHDTIYLDCDLHDAYYIDGSSANDKVTFTSNIDPYPTFPGFVPGENTVIVRDGDNLHFSVVPRWWVI